MNKSLFYILNMSSLFKSVLCFKIYRFWLQPVAYWQQLLPGLRGSGDRNNHPLSPTTMDNHIWLPNDIQEKELLVLGSHISVDLKTPEAGCLHIL